MKIVCLIFILSNAVDALGQRYYSKMFDPFNGRHEAASIMHIENDTLILRAGTLCYSDQITCSLVGKYSIMQEDFLRIEHFENIQGGTNNLLVNSITLFLASQEAILNNNLTLNQVDKATLEHVHSLDLKINDPRYSDYTIKRSVLYNNKLIVTGQVLDNNNFIGYQGWNNFQEDAVFFVLDSLLNLDTILIIPPSTGAFLKVEDLSVGPDSILYISFYEKYLKSGSSEDYLENRKVVYGLDNEYNLVFQWIGPDFSVNESFANIIIGKDTSIYINFLRDYSTIIASIDKDGSTNWEYSLDSTIGQNLFSINNLILAENGDIVGVGAVSSVIDELGQSGFLFRVDAFGKLKWKRAFRINKGFDLTVPTEFPFQSVLEDVKELPNGDLISIGYVRKYIGFENPDGPLNFDIWILQINGDGCLWENCPYIQDIITKDQYIPLVYPGNEWVVDSISSSQTTAIHRYSFSQDSILLNGKFYYKLISKSTIEGPWQETGRYMRQNNGKVFEYDPIDLSEILLYDFDLQIGDTLLPHDDGSFNRRKVIKAESVKLLDDVVRKSLTIECSSDILSTDTTKWIEGIGDVEKLFWTKTFCSTTDDGHNLNTIRCFLTDEQALYSRTDLVDCYISSTENIDFEPVSVFPNPGSEILFFDIYNLQSVNYVTLFNSLGVLALSSDGLSAGNGLDISNIPAGLYYGFISFANNEFRSFKIIVVR